MQKIDFKASFVNYNRSHFFVLLPSRIVTSAKCKLSLNFAPDFDQFQSKLMTFLNTRYGLRIG